MRLHAAVAPGGRVGDVNLEAAEFSCRVLVDRAQLGHIVFNKHRLKNFNSPRRVDVVDIQEIGLGADEAHEACHQLFSDRVDRRIGDLRKELFEVGKKRLRFLRKNRKSCVVSHRPGGLHSLGCHRHQNDVYVFLRHSEDALQLCQSVVGHRRLID